MQVRRVGIWSLSRILGFVYGCIGLLLGAFFALFSMVGAGFASMMPNQDHGSAVFGMLFGVGAIVVLPIFYGVIGLIGGAIADAVYNLGAQLLGGIELDVS